MKVHVFKATKMGWDNESEGVWFDTDLYTREQAEAQFVPVEKMCEKNGGYYPYTCYEYDSQTYHHYVYLGIFDYEHMPNVSTWF